MKLFALLTVAVSATSKCHEKSEKRLGKITTAFETWADTYESSGRNAHYKTRVNNIADKMLSHYNEYNADICNDGARMGDEEPE